MVSLVTLSLHGLMTAPQWVANIQKLEFMCKCRGLRRIRDIAKNCYSVTAVEDFISSNRLGRKTTNHARAIVSVFCSFHARVHPFASSLHRSALKETGLSSSYCCLFIVHLSVDFGFLTVSDASFFPYFLFAYFIMNSFWKMIKSLNAENNLVSTVVSLHPLEDRLRKSHSTSPVAALISSLVPSHVLQHLHSILKERNSFTLFVCLPVSS